ncbi:MAG: RNA polymerase sigma factor [Planctomycetota bacterium]|jgi:RNA polymerase sigma-70 factor (ECF subfamily)
MLEDKLLVWKLKHGSRDALRRIYEKYKNDLLALAVSLWDDRAAAEDIVHDVFVSFAEVADKLELRSSLKGYLSACVANRVRNLSRVKPSRTNPLDEEYVSASDSSNPAQSVTAAEEMQRVSDAMAQLPYQQREVIILRLQAGMKFKAIAESEGVSVNTIQARYRYGLDKLRSMLNSEKKK